MRISKQISLFFDNLVRKKGNDDLGEVVDEGIALFQFIQSKDVFESYYKHFLSRRLVASSRPNIEIERLILSKLKIDCGIAFVSKMEGMVNDIVNSRDVYEDWRRRESPRQSELEVKILTTGLWPTSIGKGGCGGTLSSPILGEFEEYYMQKFSGRKLSWNYALGTMEIKVSPEGYLLTVSVIQGHVLMRIDEVGKCSLSWLRMHFSGCAETELRRHFLSLIVNQKCRLLVPASDIRNSLPKSIDDLSDTDEWAWNDKFIPVGRHVRVPLILTSLGDVATPATGDAELIDTGIGASVEEDRKHLVEATIVRVMKTRRILDLNQIVIEVTRILSPRFLPSVDMIKGRIDNLGDREFLRKDESEDKMYHYVA